MIGVITQPFFDTSGTLSSIVVIPSEPSPTRTVTIQIEFSSAVEPAGDKILATLRAIASILDTSILTIVSCIIITPAVVRT